MLVFDGHNDSLMEYYFESNGSMTPFLSRHSTKHVDLPRAVEAGLGGGICAICTPPTAEGFKDPGALLVRTANGYELPLPEPLDPSFAVEFGESAVRAMNRLEDEAAGRLTFVRSAADLDRFGEGGPFLAVAHLEGAEPVRPDLSNLDHLYEMGLRSIGPVWSRPNAFGHGVPFKFPSSPDTGPGLTEAGRKLVQECYRMGIMVDLSHITERGFWDVVAMSDRPIIVSHSAAHSISPSARNLTNRQLDAIAESDGLVGVTFHVPDVRSDGDRDPSTPVDRIVDHILYIGTRIGFDHVALGSDFDGAMIPAEMNDVGGLPILFKRLHARGVDWEQCRKIASDNWIRVLKAVFCGSGT